jgi:ABC-2 type transport system ATP-binding protein
MTTQSNSETIISLQSLTKYYGETKGIEDVTFTVQKGSIHGFLGPNGAGKTTTIRALIGILDPTSGSATINGYLAGSVGAKRLIGYLPSDFGLYKHYTVGEYLDYLETLRGEAPYRQELVELLQLDETRRTGELSRGNRQKVCIVQALMHEPEILIADEPTSGLDPLMQAKFNEYLKKYVERGGTVFISSHILADVQEICDVITVIREGNIVSTGHIDHLLGNMHKKAKVRLVEGADINEVASQLGAEVGIKEFERYTLYFEGSLKEVGLKLARSELIEDFILPEPSLEEYFMKFYAGDE